MAVRLLFGVLFAASAPCTTAFTTRDTTGNHTLLVQDPQLGPSPRRFLVESAPSCTSSAKLPLVLGFHGQSNSPETWGPRSHFTQLAKAHGWLMVYPAAIWENKTTDSGTDSTWNVGSMDDDSTCLAGTTSTQCLASCANLNKCNGRCNWATCYDDTAFIDQLLTKLHTEYCADVSRIFLVGESNGGMFIHYLISTFPGRFLAAAPVFGLPLLGYLVGDQYQLVKQRAEAQRTSVLQLHDRSDLIIPWQGGADSDGWLYESMSRSLGVWSAIHSCGGLVQNHNAFEGGSTNVNCWKYDQCEDGKFVGFCKYDGGHVSLSKYYICGRSG